MTGITISGSARVRPDGAGDRTATARPDVFLFDELLFSLDARLKRIGAPPMNLVEGKVSDGSLLVAGTEVSLPDRTAGRLAGHEPVGVGAAPVYFEFPADPAARTFEGLAVEGIVVKGAAVEHPHDRPRPRGELVA